jgi:2-dehydro-3-deoxygalactonokinase
MALLDSPAPRKRKGERALAHGMGWAQTFIAVDWGTTNRRAWRIEGGQVAQEFEDGRGILSVQQAEFPVAVAELRERLGDHPLLMAGMIGSNRGWVEAPYVPCPVGLGHIAAALTWAEPARTAIVPGLSSDDPPDVMRGEEVQILGAVEAGLVPADSLVCHPGTHNKWVALAGGRVERFRTVMTGELFSLLRSHSILSDLLADDMTVDDAFCQGVTRGLEGDALTAELFSVRASVLLGQRAKQDATDFTSGLLIGADIGVGLKRATGGEIYVMGRPDLTRRYAAALDVAGRQAVEIDGETAFLAGIQAIAGRF